MKMKSVSFALLLLILGVALIAAPENNPPRCPPHNWEVIETPEPCTIELTGPTESPIQPVGTEFEMTATKTGRVGFTTHDEKCTYCGKLRSEVDEDFDATTANHTVEYKWEAVVGQFTANGVGLIAKFTPTESGAGTVTYTFTCNDGDPTKTVTGTFTSVGISRFEIQADHNGKQEEPHKFAKYDLMGVNQNLEFLPIKAIPKPEDVDFPEGYPKWTGFDGADQFNGKDTLLLSLRSAGAFVITATCGVASTDDSHQKSTVVEVFDVVFKPKSEEVVKDDLDGFKVFEYLDNDATHDENDLYWSVDEASAAHVEIDQTGVIRVIGTPYANLQQIEVTARSNDLTGEIIVEDTFTIKLVPYKADVGALGLLEPVEEYPGGFLPYNPENTQGEKNLFPVSLNIKPTIPETGTVTLTATGLSIYADNQAQNHLGAQATWDAADMPDTVYVVETNPGYKYLTLKYDDGEGMTSTDKVKVSICELNLKVQNLGEEANNPVFNETNPGGYVLYNTDDDNNSGVSDHSLIFMGLPIGESPVKGENDLVQATVDLHPSTPLFFQKCDVSISWTNPILPGFGGQVAFYLDKEKANPLMTSLKNPYFWIEGVFPSSCYVIASASSNGRSNYDKATMNVITMNVDMLIDSNNNGITGLLDPNE